MKTRLNEIFGKIQLNVNRMIKNTRLQKIINKTKSNLFVKMYILIFLPVLIVLFFDLFSSVSYTKSYKELLKIGYLEKLESICTQNETSLQNITTIIRILSENKELPELITASPTPKNHSANAISEILGQVKSNNRLIDCIYIYNRSNATVYSDSGASHATNFFRSQYCYADYPKSYWDNYTSLDPDYDMKILTPSLVSNADTQKTVIPIVFTKFGDIDADNLVIVNVDLTDILSTANNSKLTENSIFFILNKNNRIIFSENNDVSHVFGDSFYYNVGANRISSFDYYVNDSNALIMSYSPDSSVLGYAYIAIVPYSDINSRTVKLIYMMVILGIFTLISVFLGVYFSTKKIYTPIESLASMFDDNDSPDTVDDNEDETANNDMLQKLHSSVQQTLEANNSLYNKYTKYLPLVKERYLINLLNSNEHYTPDKEQTELLDDFVNEYFCSVVIKLLPTDEFYNLFNNVEYNAIQSGLYEIIEAKFAEKYALYVIPSETNTLYVLLNLTNDNEMESILEIIEKFRHDMDYDKQYMTVKIGVGHIYKNLSGLKKSHHEAINSVSNVIGLSHVRINDDSTKMETYDLTINDENTLLNHLILGHIDEAEIYIDDILAKNITQNISDAALMQLYIQILNIVFKVMRMKKIDYDPDSCGDFQIIAEIIKLPIPEVYDTILKYIEIIQDHTNITNTKVDIQSVISYINEHYSDDLGLETIADNFNTTSKYLSKLIKDKLGVNFVDYLAGIRISAAKQLLIESNKNISEIYEDVGFNNRATFIRTFKKNSGLTPSEFRKNRSK